MDLPQRKRIRMQGYNYSSAGVYCVTICTKDREHYFGHIDHGVMHLNQLGTACAEIIAQLLQRRLTVDVHAYIVMPNHIHMILVMGERTSSMTKPVINTRRDGGNERINGNAKSVSLQQNIYQGPTLGSIVGMMKQSVTRYAKEHDIAFGRQERFYEQVIRNQQQYDHMEYYIQTNSEKRTEDKFYQ